MIRVIVTGGHDVDESEFFRRDNALRHAHVRFVRTRIFLGQRIGEVRIREEVPSFPLKEKAALALNKAAIGYQELARQAETDRALYESVLRQIKETNLTKDVKTNAVSIAEHASLPHGPVSPIPSKAITLGLLAGLVAGLTFVFGADALDRSIKTVDQAEAILGLPVLAAVPETRSAELKKGNKGDASRDGAITYRLVEEAPEGPVAEAFRNLRASLSLLGPEPDRKTFLFTSALPTEGKSFTSVNYALALAQQGHRVLLILCPSINRMSATFLAWNAARTFSRLVAQSLSE